MLSIGKVDKMASEKKPEKKIHIVFVVSGTPVKLNVELDETLAVVFPEAVKKAEIAGDPKLDDWEFSFDKVVLDVNKPIREFGFPEDAQVFLSKKAGAAG
jgi:hypothetical protein